MRSFVLRATRIAFCCCLLFAGSAHAATVDLKVMSFNVRRGVTLDELIGPDGWLSSPVPRGDLVMQTIDAFGPDLLGVQEPVWWQIDYMEERLPGYSFYGVGRDDGVEAGEYAGIFYRSDRFTVVDSGEFWLSNTPNTPGTAFGPDPTPRITTWLKLEDHSSGQTFLYMNTHWDHSSTTARNNSATLTRSLLPSLAGDLPILMTGDFNASENSTALRTLRGNFDPSGAQLLDSYREVHAPSGNEATYHGFSGSTSGTRIDHILHTDEFTAVDATIVRTSYSGRYPSDHFPVTATLRMEVAPEPAGWLLLALGAGVWFAVRRR